MYLDESENEYGAGWRRFEVRVKGRTFIVRADSLDDAKEYLGDADFLEDLEQKHEKLADSIYREILFEAYTLTELD